MSRLTWYWHRLRAMSPVEMALQVRKKLRERADARQLPDWSTLNLQPTGDFPKLPSPSDAPPILREALQRDVENILAGKWKAFGHLELEVDDPPKWHCDYLVGRDFATTESAFKLDHRALPGGGDIKLIWELSRWHQLVRLAMAAYVIGDARAANKCVEWLEDWVKHNPPYRGWNWTSALEAGLRLIQFTWIDALLTSAGARTALSAPSESDMDARTKLSALRRAILPPHVWFAWRHQSFGSSANNHLLGELAGCIVATVRWPELARCGASLTKLQRRWEREVLAQFAPDGGNWEQALNYQLFSWELCWQAFMALQALRDWKPVRGHVDLRLASAAHFFREVQVNADYWDYGDSDNAFVLPHFAHADQAVGEWRSWFKGSDGAIAYWMRDARPRHLPIALEFPLNTRSFGEWEVFQDTGIGICESGFWWLRWDLSPLGYPATAAHGHLDALHLSIWFKGIALIIDPGTGAYYAEPGLRAWLASRAAHNAPCPAGPEQPRRLGPFLWSGHHRPPSITHEGGKSVDILKLKRRLNPTQWEENLENLPVPVAAGGRTAGELSLVGQLLRRSVEPLPDGAGWLVKDECIGKDGRPIEFTVRWQFAPETQVKRLEDRRFLLRRHDVAIELQVSEGWSDVVLMELDSLANSGGPTPATPGGLESSVSAATGKTRTAREDARPTMYEGIVSPAFRKTLRAPYLKLIARPAGRPCVFSTTFLAWPRA